ncbi:MAG: hypothetical protein IJW49_02870 [Clostridia bacterium]|nr:hypothetical protein [Clostridia bacterium]
MEKNNSRITVFLFIVMIFGFSLAFLLTPDQAFSEQENRSLRTFPRFSWDALASGDYSADINDYFADQYPLRDLFVGVKAVSELALGKGENNGVLLGEDGQLAQRLFDISRADGTVTQNTDRFDALTVSRAAEGINRAAQNAQVPFHVLLTGRTLDITASSFSYSNESGDALRAALGEQLDGSVRYIDTIPTMIEKHRLGESVYYKTDHHWTTLGAYYAYVETMRSFGMENELLPPTAFEQVVASDAFYGTAWSKSGMKFVSPDTLELWLRGNEDAFTVIADGVPVDGLYAMEYLGKKDKYSVFLDGTHDVVTVTKKDGEPRPTLLLLKDSFANSLAPFLAQHFDLILLNLSSARSDFTNVTALAEKYGVDRVLLVYTLENVIGASKLQKLR